MKKLYWLIAGSLLFLSCQSTMKITEKKFICSQLDWFELGRSDGVQGLDSQGYKSKQSNCDGFTKANHESYVNGWYAGVDEFCSPAHGFAFGRSGYKYLNVCPTSKEEAFLQYYRKGMRVFLYEKESQQINEELQKITDNASSNKQKVPDVLKRMTALETRLELNRALISEIQKEMDETLSQTETL